MSAKKASTNQLIGESVVDVPEDTEYPRLPPKERALFYLALSVFGTIALLILVILLHWACDYPRAALAAGDPRMGLELLLRERSGFLQEHLQFIDAVTKVLVPFFTAALGGVIGYQAGRGSWK